MLLGDSIGIWSFIVLTVVFFNIDAREGDKQYLFRSILNTNQIGFNNTGVSNRNTAIFDVTNHNIKEHSTANLRQIGSNYTPTIILKTGISRIIRETPDINVINPNIINGSHFLKFVPDKINKDAFENIFNICSEIRICNHTVVPDFDPEEDVGRCCLQCDCSPTCHERRSCCPTVEPVDKPEVEDNDASSCQYPVLFSNLSNPSEYMEETAEFSFVRSCPPGSDTQTIIACEQPYMGPGYSMIFNYFTDEDSTVNFANRHCAKCNYRTQNLHVWLPQVRCKLRLNVLSILELEEEVRVREDCYFEFKPPDTVDVNSTICFSNVINQCNTTDQWRVYDAVLEKACDTIETLYTVHTTNKRYANIFCAICNGETITLPRKHTCQEDRPEVETSFMLLLAYSLNKETNHFINKCELAKLKDPITNMCEKVHCSYPLRLNSYNVKCVDGLQFTRWGRIVLPMRVVYKVPVQISDVKLLSTVIKQTINKNKVFFCKMMIYSKTELALWQWRKLLETQRGDIIVTESLIIVELDPVYNVKLPFAILNDIKASMTFQEYNSKNNNLAFETIVGNLDTWILFTGNEQPAFIDERLENKNANGEFVYEDPYSKHVVIGHIDLSFDYCYYAGSSVLFAEDFMECPTFLYDITQHGIKRYPRGLLLSSMNVTFDFGTFQSKNESHVYICTDSVISLVGYSACTLVCMSTYLLNGMVVISLLLNSI